MIIDFIGKDDNMFSNVSKEKQREYTLLSSVVFTFFVSGAASQPLGSFIPFLRESYGFSYDFSGVLLSCQSLGNFFSVLAVGFLPALVGRRRSILITSVWMAAAYLIFASGIGSPALMVAAFLMTGVARGGNSNFSNTMVSTLTEPLATKGYNMIHGGFAVGALLSPLILIFCVGLWPVMGWRIMAAVLCLVCIGQIIVYAKMDIPSINTKSEGKAMDFSFLKVRQFWFGSAMLFFYISAEYAIVGWLVTYFQDMGVLSANHSQMMNSLLWLVIFIGRMVGVAITGKISREAILLTDGFGLCVFFALMLFSRTPLMIVIGIIGVGFFMATIYPTAFAYGSECVKANDLGCSIMIFSGSAGGIITPALVGIVAEHAGIHAGMGLVALFTFMLLISIICSVISMKKSRTAA